MKKTTAKPIRTVKPKPVASVTESKPSKKPRLSKKDPAYYSKIGKISAAKRKMTSEQFSAMAKLSHPRREYKGGRKKNEEDEA